MKSKNYLLINKELDENGTAYELKVERNLGRMINEYRNSPSVRYKEVLKVMKR